MPPECFYFPKFLRGYFPDPLTMASCLQHSLTTWCCWHPVHFSVDFTKSSLYLGICCFFYLV